MKRIITIIVLTAICFFFIFGKNIPVKIVSENIQRNDTIPYNKNLSSYGYIISRIIVDSGLVIPNGDTTFGTDNVRVGAMVYRTVGGDSTLYIRLPSRWVRIGTAGLIQILSKNAAGDSIFLSGGGGSVLDRDTQQLSLITGAINGDTLKLTASTPVILPYLARSALIDSLNNNRQILGYNATTNRLWLYPPAGDTVSLNSASVFSVNGKTGAVTLTTDSINEGSNNLYFTPTRVRSSIFGSNGIGFNAATGIISTKISTASGNSILVNPDGLYVTVPSDSEIINKVNIYDSNKVFTTPTYIRNQGFINNETDPIANAKTITLNSGTGIAIQGNTYQALGTNPNFTINAQNTSPIWNANQIQGYPLSNAIPVNGQVLQLNGGVWVPTTQSDTSAKFTLTFASNFGNTFQNNPITGTGTIYVNTDSTKVGTLYALNDTAKSISSRLNIKLDINDTTGNWAPRGDYVHPADTIGKWSPVGNYKMNYDSIASTGYPSNNALNDSLNKINGINGWLYSPATKTGQVDSTKYSTVRATHDSIVANIPNLSIYTKYTDTSSMLAPYTKKGSNVSQFNNDSGYLTPFTQANANWNATSGAAQILNKPNEINFNIYNQNEDSSVTVSNTTQTSIIKVNSGSLLLPGNTPNTSFIGSVFGTCSFSNQTITIYFLMGSIVLSIPLQISTGSGTLPFSISYVINFGFNTFTITGILSAGNNAVPINLTGVTSNMITLNYNIQAVVSAGTLTINSSYLHRNVQ